MQRTNTVPRIVSQARPSAKVIPLKKARKARNDADIHAPEPKNKRKFMFTDQALRKLKLPPRGDQVPYYDTVQKGLSVLVGYEGTKSFRSTYYINRKPRTRTIGRLGENSIETGENFSTTAARERVRQDRAMANQGLDPKVEEAKARNVAKANEFTVQQAIDRFVEEHCKVSQRSWTQTESTLLRTCKPWLNRPVNSITRTDCRERIKEIVASGEAKNKKKKMHATGRQSLAWIKTLWKWLAGQELIEHDTMHPVTMTFQKPSRDRVYSDKEIRSIWRAAGKLPAEEQVYVRLMILLAPRKTALAAMMWGDLDQAMGLWTTPDNYVKKRKLAPKRTYKAPLPKLARAVLSKLKRGKPDERVMPSLRMQLTPDGRPMFDPVSIQRALKRWGAPSDMILHAFRHTVATWLEEQGHEPWSRGLVLNHAEQGVTANYSHSPSMRRKLENLEQWAAHIAKIVA